MKNNTIYTMTIKMAQGGTEHIEEGKSSSSTAGHMWYTLAKDGEQTDSYGFGPTHYGVTDVFGMYTDGYVTTKDDESYQSTYATYEVQISKEQYDKLQDFGVDENLEANGFKDYYKVASNSCVDYVYKAMEYAGVNPDKFQGDMLPRKNRDDVNEHLYKAINGTQMPKEEHDLESQSKDGSFDAIYGSKGADILTSTKETEAVYGGIGDDTLNGIANHVDRLRGGTGEDTYKVQNGDFVKDSDNQGKVYFDATLLSGIKHKVSENVYEDAMFTYTKEANNLHIAQKEDPSKSVTIEHWNSQTNQALGIELSETKEQTQANEQSAVTSAMIDSHTLQEAKQIEEEHYSFSPQLQNYLDQFAPQNAQGYDSSYDMGMEIE